MNRYSSLARRVGRLTLSGLTILAGVYAAIIFLYWGLGAVGGEGLELVALGNSLMPVILIPSLLLLPIMVLAKRWVVAAALLPIAGLLILTYGGRFLPHPVATAHSDAAVPISVLTYNLASRIADFDPMIANVREADPDIVAFQELLTPAANAFEGALGDRYPYRVMHPADDFARGIGILSKFPISDAHYFDEIILGSMRARLTLTDGREMIFYSAHPVSPRVLGGFDASRRSSEIALLLEDARQYVDQPIVLAGDFNATDRTRDYTAITAQFRDAYQEVGFGFGPTFPNMGRWGGLMTLIPPMIRIDYVFYGQTCLSAVNARVISDNGGSDHYPLYAELRCE